VRCRLLYLVGQLSPGGLERQLCYLLKVLDRDRYCPAVALWSSSKSDIYVPTIRSLDVPIYEFSNMRSGFAKLRALRRLVRQYQPEVVHSYTFYTNFPAHWAVRGTPCLAVGSIRCDFAFEMKTTGACLGRLSARWPRNQICNSSLAAEMVRRYQSPFVPRRLFVVRNGLDLQQFRGTRPATGKIHIVGVGSLEPRKRWDRLLTAARELKSRGYDFSLQIVGDGSLYEVLKQQAQVLGLADRVEFVRYNDNIPGVLANATFLVHTSDSEGYPNVVMEAMASSRPVVATDAGDVPSIVEDGGTGFVVGRESASELLDRMIILMTSPELCRRMGEAGRRQAERQFGLDRLVSETLDAYRAMGWNEV
jgi:glycosyltransferase involved in cell wall biosynthesis